MTDAQPAPLPDEYPGYDTEVVSPELPCGAAWLANCLLELDVPVWNPWWFDTRGEWERLAPRRYRYTAAHLPWRQTLPALTAGREFHFAARPLPRFSHCWPSDLDSTHPVVLFVRDPRDALYSEWRRQLRNGGPAASTFEAFVAMPYHHHPFSFADYLVRFLDAWHAALSDTRSLVVRFEDYKSDALRTLDGVCRFLGVVATEDQRVRATTRSDFAVVKGIEDELVARDDLQRQFNRRGMAFEFRETYTASMHAAVGRRFDALCRWLGYEVPA